MVARGKMKAVKCNTRKVLLTRNRSLIPPALSLQLRPPFLRFTSHPSTKVQELSNRRTGHSTECSFSQNPSGNKGDWEEIPKAPTLPRSPLYKATKCRPKDWLLSKTGTVQCYQAPFGLSYFHKPLCPSAVCPSTHTRPPKGPQS